MKQTQENSRDSNSGDRRGNRSVLRRIRGRRIRLGTNGQRGGSIGDYLRKLKQMVPTIHTDEKLNEFEILQRVIEYIQMLEEALGIIVNTERAVVPSGKESLQK